MIDCTPSAESNWSADSVTLNVAEMSVISCPTCRLTDEVTFQTNGVGISRAAPVGRDGRTMDGWRMQSTEGLLLARRATRLVRGFPVLLETVMYMFTVSFVSANTSASPLPASFVIRLLFTTTLPVDTLSVTAACTKPHSAGFGLGWQGWPVPSSGSLYWRVAVGWAVPSRRTYSVPGDG